MSRNFVSTFEWVIALLLGAVALSALARRIKIPYPTFLAVGGALVALVPSSPSWTLEPDLALALFVAPVLTTVRTAAALNQTPFP